MKVYETPSLAGPMSLASVVKAESGKEAIIDVGFASFKSGVLHPLEGYSAHTQHEVSLILDGELDIETEDGAMTVVAGQVVHLAPHEKHRVTAKSDSSVYYVLFGEAGA